MCSKLTLLNYDPDPAAVLTPAANNEPYHVPAKLLYLLVDDEHYQQFVQKYHGIELTTFDTITKISRVYQIEYQHQTMACAQAPLGASAATMFLDFLIAGGAKQIMTEGSCGALIDLPENQILLPTAALRDEGTSFHYLPAADWVTVNQSVNTQVAATLTAANVPYHQVKTWTTDGFFRETPQKVQEARAKGCQVVEMECAGLAACAEFRQVAFGQLLYTADSLAELTAYDPRDWGNDGIEVAIQLAADCLLAL